MEESDEDFSMIYFRTLGGISDRFNSFHQYLSFQNEKLHLSQDLRSDSYGTVSTKTRIIANCDQRLHYISYTPMPLFQQVCTMHNLQCF